MLILRIAALLSDLLVWVSVAVAGWKNVPLTDEHVFVPALLGSLCYEFL